MQREKKKRKECFNLTVFLSTFVINVLPLIYQNWLKACTEFGVGNGGSVGKLTIMCFIRKSEAQGWGVKEKGRERGENEGKMEKGEGK